jgi:hypothetical protein
MAPVSTKAGATSLVMNLVADAIQNYDLRIDELMSELAHLFNRLYLLLLVGKHLDRFIYAKLDGVGWIPHVMD